jgi:hypothetical protein
MASGLRSLLCLRVLRPSLAALRSNRVVNLPGTLQVAEGDPLLDRYFEAVAACGRSMTVRSRAVFDIGCVLVTQGIALVDLTPAALPHYSMESNRLRVTAGGRGEPGRFAGRLAWDVLHQMGHFAPGTPHSLQACLNTGQLSAAELVDRYGVRQPDVRQLLVDYLERRRPECDYSTWFALALRLAGLFWRAIEEINPGQGDLRIAEHVYEQWRAGLNTRIGGGDRLRPEAVLMAVRAFYLDIQTWAVEQPSRWAPWAAPSPVPPSALRSSRARKRRVSERVAGRIRERQPLLATLVAHVEVRHRRLRELLDVAAQVAPGAAFHHAGSAYRRADGRHDREAARAGYPLVRVVDELGGTVTNLTIEEEAAFWEWACVKTMRHSCVRVEELVELTPAEHPPVLPPQWRGHRPTRHRTVQDRP